MQPSSLLATSFVAPRNTAPLSPTPQENMHVSSLFQLCQKVPEADVFECLPPDAYTEVRKLMIDLILDTDMAAHFHR